jgi:hypothetical protein
LARSKVIRWGYTERGLKERKRVCRYMLSVLTFICKCTGVGEPEFEDLIFEAG